MHISCVIVSCLTGYFFPLHNSNINNSKTVLMRLDLLRREEIQAVISESKENGCILS